MTTNKVDDIIVGTDEDINSDLNGECFIAGAEGEPEVFVENNVVLFPEDMTAATDASERTGVNYGKKEMAAFIMINVHYSLARGRSGEISTRVAYLRFLAARNGLISPSFTVNLHKVRYNHAIFVKEKVNDIIENEGGVYDKAIEEIKRHLKADARKNIIGKFTNLVCCVAYMFRVRGHHYMADFQDRYTTLWARCLYKPEDLPLDWEFIATDALHAIMPDVLDNFWIESANNARCAGTLIKRLDSAPAGAAGVVALERGLNDVTMLFPAVVEKVPDSYAEFQAIIHHVKDSRWGGSINARFYGATRHRIDEAKIGALAAVVMGIYENLAPQSKLRDSQALQRLAQIAPATGGAIGMAAARAAKDERLNLIGYAVSAPAPE